MAKAIGRAIIFISCISFKIKKEEIKLLNIFLYPNKLIKVSDKDMFVTAEIIAIITGVLVSLNEKNAFVIKGIKLLEIMPKQNKPTAAAVSLVSFQPNWPVPKIKRTAWALNKNRIIEAGIIK